MGNSISEETSMDIVEDRLETDESDTESSHTITASTHPELVPTKGRNGKNLRRRVKPASQVTKEQLHTPQNGKIRNNSFFPLLDLPAEIQNLILEYCLVADQPIQPVDCRAEQPKFARDHRIFHAGARRFWHSPSLNLAILRTCHYLYDMGKPILYGNNIIDFSGLFFGSLTIRRFRRIIGPENCALVKHVFICSRVIVSSGGQPDDGQPKAPQVERKLRMARTKADLVLLRHLSDLSIFHSINKTFEQIRSINIRFNDLDWTIPKELRHDFFHNCKEIHVVNLRWSKPGRSVKWKLFEPQKNRSRTNMDQQGSFADIVER